MLDKLKSLAVFSAVAESGSFRGAAKSLGLAPSVVSQHVSSLEQHLGTALLYRSTRHVSLTTEGEKLYGYAKKIVQTAEEALDEFASEANRRLTDLRLAIPAVLCSHPVFERVTDFARRHPGIRLTIATSDQQHSLLKGVVDVAIRMGQFGDSELKSKVIGEERAVLVGTAHYVGEQPPLTTPSDLKNWHFISFSPVPNNLEIREMGKKVYGVGGETAAATDSVETVRHLILSGLGVGLLPMSLIAPDLKAGRLEHILPGIADKPLPIQAVWPRNATLKTSARALIDHLSAV